MKLEGLLQGNFRCRLDRESNTMLFQFRWEDDMWVDIPIKLDPNHSFETIEAQLANHFEIPDEAQRIEVVSLMLEIVQDTKGE